MASHLWGDEITEITNGLINTCKKFFQRYSSFKFYKSLIIEDSINKSKVEIELEDFVMISGYNSYPGYYIGQVKSLFDLHDNDLQSQRAAIKWFYLPTELPIKQRPKVVKTNEIFFDMKNTIEVIDATTITGRCQVTRLLPNQIFPSVKNDEFFYKKGLMRGTVVDLNEEVVSETPKIQSKIRSDETSRRASTPRSSTPKASTPRSSTPKASTPRASTPRASKSRATLAIKSFSDIITSNEKLSSRSLRFRKDQKTSSSKPQKISDLKPPKKVATASNVFKLDVNEAANQLFASQQSSDEDQESEETSSIVRSRRISKEFKSLPKLKPAPKFKSFKTSISKLAPDLQLAPTAFNKRAVNKRAITSSASRAPAITSSASRVKAENKSEIDVRRSTRSRKVRMFSVDISSDPEDEDFKVNSKEDESSEDDFESKQDVSMIKIRRKNSLKRALLPKRDLVLDKNKPIVEQAKQLLHVSSLPDSLPCREDKFEEIYNFVETHLSSGSGGCLFVSGVPGTGKTATVHQVLSTLQQQVQMGQIKSFNLVQINGMKLTEPHQAYVQILQQLTGQKASASSAADILTSYFDKRHKNTTLLVVDELDLLWTRKQDVLYHLFDWPSLCHARLIVVSIANTMDLPERVLSHRVSSRLGMTRTSFLPYTFNQLRKIVESRVLHLQMFDANAIELAARKVAAVSGDARRCLDICRRSVDLIKNLDEKVGMKEVQEALQEMFTSPIISFIKNASIHEKLFLMSIVHQYHKSGLEEALISQILSNHSFLCYQKDLHPISTSAIIQICNKLNASKIINVENNRNELFARLRLNVPVDDVLFAIKCE